MRRALLQPALSLHASPPGLGAALCQLQAILQAPCAAAAAAPAAAPCTAWRQLRAAPLTSSAAAARSSQPEQPAFRVAELLDAHSGPFGSPEQQGSALQVLRPELRNYGGRQTFCGEVTTVKCLHSNVLVHEAVKEPGQGRVLVIDGGASLQCSIIGDILASVAAKHGWEGMVINGCVRDTASLRQVPLGIKALAANPHRPGKGEPGQRDASVVLGGVAISPGDWLYSDEDGILVSPGPLEMPEAEQLAQLKAALAAEPES